MTKLHIVFVPGLWEGPAVFDTVATELRSYGYDISFAPLASTGKASPGNPSMSDDIRGIRSVIEPLVLGKKDVILVMHSAGGFLGSSAIKGLGSAARNAQGETGGVQKLVFLAAGLANEGYEHSPRPFIDYQGERSYCKDPMNLLFNDLPEADALFWLGQLQCQPGFGWDETTTYCGWRDVPSVYLICKDDAILPEQFQLQLAQLGGCEVVECRAGHMVMLSAPHKVVEVVRMAAGEIS